jgi:surface protein
MSHIFYGCSKITSIDLSNFDFSSVTDMTAMFEDCYNLEKINFGNINTSSVIYMSGQFLGCSKISSIDLSNFDTSKVTDMSYMFRGCHNLLYLDLSNFDTTNIINIDQIFYGCFSLIYLNMYFFKFTNLIFNEFIFYGLPSYTKYCVQDDNTAKYLLKYINKTSDCSHFCFKKNKKLDLYNKTCTDLCIKNKILYEYNNICYLKCPAGTLVNNGLCEDINCEENNYNKCLSKIPENYYYDSIDQLYKKCFYTCKKCNGHGKKIYHNCLECKNNFTFLNDSKYSTNCYKKCEYYFYFDEYNIYRCTENYECPKGYNKLILDKKKCINECKNDNIYQYEFENKCLLSCPNETYYKESDKICYNKHFIEGTIIQDIKQTDKEEDFLEAIKVINNNEITITNEFGEINESIKFNYTLKTDVISLESDININENIEKFRNYILNMNISENNEDKM